MLHRFVYASISLLTTLLDYVDWAINKLATHEQLPVKQFLKLYILVFQATLRRRHTYIGL